MKRDLQLAAFLMTGVLLGNLMGGFVRAQTYLVAQEVPRGTILLMTAACPTGYTEVTALNGAMPYGTIAANGDVGTTGGSNTITPTVATLTAAAQTFTGNAGTVPAETFTGSAGTVPAETFTGTPFSSVINHTHTVTVTYNVQGGTTASTTGTHVMTSTATGGSARAPTSGDVVSATTANPSGGVSSITPAGTNSTVSFTPAGTNGTVSFTPSGTNGTSAVTGTLNSFDNRPAFVKVIFCQKS